MLRGAQRGPGVRGRAIELNGTNGAFFPGLLANLNVKDREPFTVSVWVRTEQTRGTVFALRSEAGGAFGGGLTILGLWVEDDQPRAWIRTDGGVFFPAILKGKADLAPGEWHHLAFMRHPDTTMELFADGVSVEHQGLARESSGPLTTRARAVGMEPLQWKEANWPNFSGALDEFCMFNRALAPAEIAKLAGRGP
jgi:hypothetical protein